MIFIVCCVCVYASSEAKAVAIVQKNDCMVGSWTDLTEAKIQFVTTETNYLLCI